MLIMEGLVPCYRKHFLLNLNLYFNLVFYMMLADQSKSYKYSSKFHSKPFVFMHSKSFVPKQILFP